MVIDCISTFKLFNQVDTWHQLTAREGVPPGHGESGSGQLPSVSLDRLALDRLTLLGRRRLAVSICACVVPDLRVNLGHVRAL